MSNHCINNACFNCGAYYCLLGCQYHYGPDDVMRLALNQQRQADLAAGRTITVGKVCEYCGSADTKTC
jgi:hypothetical protein